MSKNIFIMDYEKAYKDALEIARKINSGEGVAAPPDWTTYEVIFPELRDVDERIRNVIRGWIYTQPTSFFDNGISKEEMLAWLEKQGKQKVNNDFNDFKAEDWYVSKVDGKIHNIYHNGRKDKWELVKEWTEEDEKRIDRICNFVWKNRKGDTDEIYQQEQDVNWLKSLKQRIEKNNG